MKKLLALATLAVAALAFAAVAAAKNGPPPVGVGTPVFVIGSESCPGFVPPTLGIQNVGWSVDGTVTAVDPSNPSPIADFQSDRQISLSGSFTDGAGEDWDVSGTVSDTSLFHGAPGTQGLVFSGFGEVKLKGDRGDHLYGQANVRFVTGPGELDIYFTPAAPTAAADSDGPVGITNCHVK
jgi:hypothetical protein